MKQNQQIVASSPFTAARSRGSGPPILSYLSSHKQAKSSNKKQTTSLSAPQPVAPPIRHPSDHPSASRRFRPLPKPRPRPHSALPANQPGKPQPVFRQHGAGTHLIHLARHTQHKTQSRGLTLQQGQDRPPHVKPRLTRQTQQIGACAVQPTASSLGKTPIGVRSRRSRPSPKPLCRVDRATLPPAVRRSHKGRVFVGGWRGWGRGGEGGHGAPYAEAGKGKGLMCDLGVQTKSLDEEDGWVE